MAATTPLSHFRQRFLVHFLLLFVVVMMIFSWTAIHFGWKFIRQELDGRGRMAAQMLSRLSTRFFVKGDAGELEDLLLWIRRNDSDIAGGAFIKSNGEILTSMDPLLPAGLFQPVRPGTVILSENRQKIFLEPIIAPDGTAAGAVAVHLNPERVTSVMRKAAGFLILSLLIMFCFMFFLLHYLLEEAFKVSELSKANEELKRLQERILKAERLTAIGKLSSSIAHELRNPLSSLRNAIYYFREGLNDNPLLKNDPAMAEMLQMADLEINSSLSIISDLMDFSKITKLDLAQVDLNFVLERLPASLIIPQNVQMDVQGSETLPRILCDAQKMRQVFINIATNAFQAMPRGGKLTIKSRLEPGLNGDGPWVSIDFTDTGHGIKEEDRPKIFEPLFTTKAKGTGLGLAISHGIVEEHGGRILVESQVGKGSTFTIRIPAKQPPATPDPEK